jgi:hypothetical protein
MKNVLFVSLMICLGSHVFAQTQPENWLKVKNEIGLYGFIDITTGEEVVPCLYEEIEDFGLLKEEWAVVKTQEGLYGIIDYEGEIILNPEFDSIEGFQESDYSIVTANGLQGLIDNQGNLLVYPQYLEIHINEE